MDYTSGTGSDTLLFRYTVQSGDLSSDLTYASEKALAGTIKDGSGNDVVLVLPTVGNSGALGHAEAIVDTVAPTVSSITAVAGTKEVKLALSEAISGSPDASDFTVKVAGSNATISSVAISSDVTLTLANYIKRSVYLFNVHSEQLNSKKIVDVASTLLPSISETAVG